MAIDAVLLNLNLSCKLYINFSKIGATRILKLTRIGRNKLFAAQTPAYTSRNFFHCPGASGEILFAFPKITHDIITPVIANVLDIQPYDNNTLNPNFVMLSLLNIFLRLIVESTFNNLVFEEYKNFLTES